MGVYNICFINRSEIVGSMKKFTLQAKDIQCPLIYAWRGKLNRSIVAGLANKELNIDHGLIQNSSS